MAILVNRYALGDHWRYIRKFGLHSYMLTSSELSSQASNLPKPQSVAVVIVNYKTPGLVKDCLASLKSEQCNDFKIEAFVGDADSQDESVGQIQSYIDQNDLTWAHCFDIGQNGGFAFGNNAVLDKYVLDEDQFDYVFFLNPDAYVLPGAVGALVSALQSDHKIAVAGARLENPDGSWRSYAFRSPRPWREFFRGARFGPLDRLFPSANGN